MLLWLICDTDDTDAMLIRSTSTSASTTHPTKTPMSLKYPSLQKIDPLYATPIRIVSPDAAVDSPIYCIQQLEHPNATFSHSYSHDRRLSAESISRTISDVDSKHTSFDVGDHPTNSTFWAWSEQNDDWRQVVDNLLECNSAFPFSPVD